MVLAQAFMRGRRSQQQRVQEAIFHEAAALRKFDMHRSYRYKDFIIAVNAESIEGIPNGKVLSLPVGYIAVVHISSGASSKPIRQLSFGQDNGRPFASEAEAVMRGYGAAQCTIDGMITVRTSPSTG